MQLSVSSSVSDVSMAAETWAIVAAMWGEDAFTKASRFRSRDEERQAGGQVQLSA